MLDWLAAMIGYEIGGASTRSAGRYRHTARDAAILRLSVWTVILAAAVVIIAARMDRMRLGVAVAAVLLVALVVLRALVRADRS